MEKFCQSCMMPLNNGENNGTNSDGEMNNKFCKYCFKNGEFTVKDITVEEMLEMSIKGLKRMKMNPIKRWFLIKSYPMMIKKLERWK